MIHSIWPEGLPDKAWSTTSGLRACLRLAYMQLKQLTHLHTARRMRWATSESMITPSDVEEVLRRIGSIPPPGGWHEPREIAEEFRDTNVSTLSMV